MDMVIHALQLPKCSQHFTIIYFQEMKNLGIKILLILEKNGKEANGGNGDLCAATIQVQWIFCNSELAKDMCSFADMMKLWW